MRSLKFAIILLVLCLAPGAQHATAASFTPTPTPPPVPFEPTKTPPPGGKTATPTPTRPAGPVYTRTPTPVLSPTATATLTPTATLIPTYFQITVYIDVNRNSLADSGEGVAGLLFVAWAGAWRSEAWSGEAGLVSIALPPELYGTKIQVQCPYLHWGELLTAPAEMGGVTIGTLRLENPEFPVFLP